jgi:hypothetical protein
VTGFLFAERRKKWGERGREEMKTGKSRNLQIGESNEIER